MKITSKLPVVNVCTAPGIPVVLVVAVLVPPLTREPTTLVFEGFVPYPVPVPVTSVTESGITTTLVDVVRPVSTPTGEVRMFVSWIVTVCPTTSVPTAVPTPDTTVVAAAGAGPEAVTVTIVKTSGAGAVTVMI